MATTLPFVNFGGHQRMLASIPSENFKRCYEPFKDQNPVIPRSEWYVVDRPRASVPILDQDGRGSCVGHGSATAAMLARDIDDMNPQLLSAPFIYAQINDGIDMGSSPADAARVLLTTGVCLMSEYPEPNYQKSQIPQTAYDTAKRFKASRIFQVLSWDEMVSAFLLGYSVFDTIRCGRNFNNLDSRGVPPVVPGFGNHCIASGDCLHKDNKGNWLLEKRNSWGEAWGLKGRFFGTEEYVDKQNQWEGYAIDNFFTDPQEINKLPGA